MSKWIWQKYKNEEKDNYVGEEVAIRTSFGLRGDLEHIYKSYSLNSDNGDVQLLGPMLVKDIADTITIEGWTKYEFGQFYAGGGEYFYGNIVYDGNKYPIMYTSKKLSIVNHKQNIKGPYIGEVTADYNAYTNNARNSDGYWYVRDREANTAPVLIGDFRELGNKNKAFTVTFQVDDSETDQSLKATVRLNGSQIKAFDNLTRKQSYTIDITDTMLRGLSFNTKNTINISLTDGQVTTEKNWYFSRVNQPAQIKVSNTNLGEQNKEFSFSFTPTDPDGDKMTAKVYIDGVQIEDLGEVTGGKVKTCTIKRADFITLKNGEHKIRIDVKDSNGSISSAFITFTKKVTWYLYEYTEELEEMPIDIRVDMLANLADGIVKKIEVCNNAKDASPSWETIEDAKWCEFKNKTKTAEKWGLGVRVRVDRGTATQDSYIYGFNISYA